MSKNKKEVQNEVSITTETQVGVGVEPEQEEVSVTAAQPDGFGTDATGLPEPTPEPEEEPVVDNTVYRPNAAVSPVGLEIKEPLSNAERAKFNVTTAMSMLYTTLNAASAAVANTIGQLADPASAGEWLEAMTNSDTFAAVANDHAGKEAWREGADWSQLVEYEGARLRPGVQGMEGSAAAVLSGAAAIRRIQSRMSMGTHIQWPCWNSGFWVTITPPTEEYLLDLNTRLSREKIELGRQTRGAIFDNYRTYIIHVLMDAILDHIESATILLDGVDLRTAIKQNLLITDITSLVLGFASTIWPHGYPMSQPCMADINKCHAVAKDKAYLSRMLWVDRNMLSSDQRRHMAGRKTLHSVESIKRYQEGFPPSQTNALDIGNDITVVLAIPTYDLYEDSGLRWIEGIIADVDDAYKTTMSAAERSEFMMVRAEIQTVRAYSQYFKTIILDSGRDTEQSIVDRTTLEELSKTLSADSGVVETIVNGVGDYVTERPVTVVGIVNYKCPSCGQYQIAPDSPQQIILPIDAINTFFTLVSHRLETILASR